MHQKYSPLRGAHIKGPIAKPRTKREIPRVAIIVTTLNCIIISTIPPEYAEETKATA